MQDSIDQHLGFVYNRRMLFLRMLFPYALTCLTLQAQLKVATERMSDIFNQFPETIVYSNETNARKSAIENDKRKKDFEDKIVAIKKLDEEGQLLIFNFQKLTTSADRTPEEAKIRSLLNKRKLEEAAAMSIQEEFIEFKEKPLQRLTRKWL